MLKVMENIFLI